MNKHLNSNIAAPATYATGGLVVRSIACCLMAKSLKEVINYDVIDVDCLDAPEFIPAGSCKSLGSDVFLTLCQQR